MEGRRRRVVLELRLPKDSIASSIFEKPGAAIVCVGAQYVHWCISRLRMTLSARNDDIGVFLG